MSLGWTSDLHSCLLFLVCPWLHFILLSHLEPLGWTWWNTMFTKLCSNSLYSGVGGLHPPLGRAPSLPALHSAFARLVFLFGQFCCGCSSMKNSKPTHVAEDNEHLLTCHVPIIQFPVNCRHRTTRRKLEIFLSTFFNLDLLTGSRSKFLKIVLKQTPVVNVLEGIKKTEI